MRVHLKGIHSVRWRLASGEIATYHYAWRGGPRLIGKPGSPEFLFAILQRGDCIPSASCRGKAVHFDFGIQDLLRIFIALQFNQPIPPTFV